MRLIDEETVTFGGDVKEIDGELYIKVNDVDKWLKNTPTAYDINKVVRQLWTTSDCYSKSIGFCDDTDCFECRHCLLTLKQSIEIVKKGGQ